MSNLQDQTVYLAAVHTAACQVEKLAHQGQLDEDILECLIQSLLVIDPPHAVAAYGGSDRLLKSGYELMVNIMNKTAQDHPDALRYTLMLLMLERKLINNPKMMQTIGDRLENIREKAQQYGIQHDYVINACGKLYEDTVSQCGVRIMVTGEPHFLQCSGTPEKIRTLLLAGIRAAMQWQYCGGRRWRLLILRRQTLAPAQDRLARINRSL
ncbi:MAG: high frequency lysogenization protein HflD [Saezia sp.]